MRHPKDSQSQAMPFIFSRIVPVIAIGIFFYLAIVIFSKKPHHEPDLISLKNWQDADAPLGYAIQREDEDGNTIETIQTFDPKLHFYQVWERAAIPQADYFESAMGTQTGGYTYNAQPFDALNKRRGGNHSGDDINGIGGQNSDLGDPVYAVADGMVVYLGNPSPGWGNCIILAHRDADGNLVQSMYAHLLNTSVHIGQLVSRGTHIGGVGQADVGYLAHLHLETRAADGVSPFLSGYPEFTQHDRMNPTKFIDDHRAPESSHIAPAALKVLEKNKILPQLSMQIDHPYDEAAFKRYQRYLIEANKSGKE